MSRKGYAVLEKIIGKRSKYQIEIVKLRSAKKIDLMYVLTNLGLMLVYNLYKLNKNNMSGNRETKGRAQMWGMQDFAFCD